MGGIHDSNWEAKSNFIWANYNDQTAEVTPNVGLVRNPHSKKMPLIEV